MVDRDPGPLECADPRPQPGRHGGQLFSGRFQSRPSYAVHRAGGSDDWLLFATEDGAGIVQSKGEAVITRPSELILLSPRQVHRYRTDPETGHWHFTWVHFLPQPHWAHLLKWPQAAHGVARLQICDPTAFAAILAHLHLMYDHGLGTRYHRDALALNALEAALLLADEHHPESPAASDGRLDPRLRIVIDRIARDLAYPWNVEALADISGWSPSRFAHRFRDALGETPRAFVERLRIDRARGLLTASALSIQAIAAEVGFDDPFHFSNRMKAVTGKSPSAWREQADPTSTPNAS
jgi:AraC family transcriptional regulator, arabinose operon regulatory protein